MEIRPIVVCVECRKHWDAADQQPSCAEPEHTHQPMELHRHNDRVTFPDGTSVHAVSFDANEPYTRDRVPDFGLYLDPVWQPPWTHDHLAWPDFGVPDDVTALASTLSSARTRARAGVLVEVGCLGGHGRTGTALACLAITSGVPVGAAVAWVRANYCSHAIETPDQEAFVHRFGSH